MRQRNRARRLALALCAGLVLAAPAAAQDDDEDLYRQTGFYLTAMGVFGVPTEGSDVERDVERSFGSSGADIDEAFGLNGRAGWRLHPRLAVEGQFEWLREFEIESRNPGPMPADPTRKDELSLFTVTGNAKGYLLTGRVQPYGILGAGWMRSTLNPDGTGAKQRDDGFLLRLGGGVDLYADEDVALSIESAYVLTPDGATEDLDYVSISAGLTLRFYGLD